MEVEFHRTELSVEAGRNEVGLIGLLQDENVVGEIALDVDRQIQRRDVAGMRCDARDVNRRDALAAGDGEIVGPESRGRNVENEMQVELRRIARHRHDFEEVDAVRPVRRTAGVGDRVAAILARADDGGAGPVHTVLAKVASCAAPDLRMT